MCCTIKVLSIFVCHEGLQFFFFTEKVVSVIKVQNLCSQFDLKSRCLATFLLVVAGRSDTMTKGQTVTWPFTVNTCIFMFSNVFTLPDTVQLRKVRLVVVSVWVIYP